MVRLGPRRFFWWSEDYAESTESAEKKQRKEKGDSGVGGAEPTLPAGGGRRMGHPQVHWDGGVTRKTQEHRQERLCYRS